MRTETSRRTAYFAVVVVLIPILVLAIGWSAALSERKSAKAALASAEAVLIDIKASAAREAKQSNPASFLDSSMTWVDTDGSSAELSIQQEIYRSAEESNLVLSSLSQVDGPPNLANPSIGFDIEGQGDHAAVANFLGSLSATRPPFGINYMSLRQVGTDGDSGKSILSIRLAIWAFSERPEAQ